MRLLALVLLAALGAPPAAAQFVSLHGGLSHSAFYDTAGGLGEVEVGVPFASAGHADAFVFDAGVYGGFAGYAESKGAFTCSHGCLDAGLGHTYAGVRLGAQLNRTLLPVRVTVGLARYHERVRREVRTALYISDYVPPPPSEASEAYAALDLGVRLRVPIAEAWSLEAGAATSLPLDFNPGALALTRFDEGRPFGPAALTLGVRWQR